MEAEIAKVLNHSSLDSKKLSELVEEYFYAADDSDVEDIETDEGHAYSLEDSIEGDGDDEEFDMRQNAVERDYVEVSSSGRGLKQNSDEDGTSSRKRGGRGRGRGRGQGRGQ